MQSHRFFEKWQWTGIVEIVLIERPYVFNLNQYSISSLIHAWSDIKTFRNLVEMQYMVDFAKYFIFYSLQESLCSTVSFLKHIFCSTLFLQDLFQSPSKRKLNSIKTQASRFSKQILYAVDENELECSNDIIAYEVFHNIMLISASIFWINNLYWPNH